MMTSLREQPRTRITDTLIIRATPKGGFVIVDGGDGIPGTIRHEIASFTTIEEVGEFLKNTCCEIDNAFNMDFV